MTEEFKLTVDRNPEIPTTATPASNVREAANAVRSGRVNPDDLVPAIPENPGIPDEAAHEDLESVEVTLPNGAVVEFGPPRGVSLTMRMIRLLGDKAGIGIVAGIYRILLSVRKINGEPPAPLTNTIEAEKLANQLGDDGIDVLLMLLNQYWPPVMISQLPTIKKNQRK